MARYRLSEKGNQAYNKMQKAYDAEVARQEAEFGKEYTEYGWSCIDDYDHIHNWDEDIDLLIFGYAEDVIDILVNWAKQEGGINSTYGFGYSYKDYISRIAERGLLEVVV